MKRNGAFGKGNDAPEAVSPRGEQSKGFYRSRFVLSFVTRRRVSETLLPFWQWCRGTGPASRQSLLLSGSAPSSAVFRPARPEAGGVNLNPRTLAAYIARMRKSSTQSRPSAAKDQTPASDGDSLANV